MKIQWFPGHMAKTMRELSDLMREVDIVAELADARVPISSRNPALKPIIEQKPRIIVLTRDDLASEPETRRWIAKFVSDGVAAVSCNSKTGAGCDRFLPCVKKVISDKLERREARGLSALSVKVAVVGIPNVGKSSFINRISGKSPAKSEDRPGVTRKLTWFRLDKGIDLLDTPGLLRPKLTPEAAGENLAFTGAIRDELFDTEELAGLLLARLYAIMPAKIAALTALPIESAPHELLQGFGAKRGFLMRGGVVDTVRAASVLLDEFRAGKIGRITLERVGYVYPPDPPPQNRE